LLSRFKQLSSRIWQHRGFQRYFANTSWVFAERILRIITGLLVTIWVARYLGPVQFGILSYAIAFAALFGSIAKLGLDSIVVRKLVQQQDQIARYLGTAFYMKLSGALIMLFAIAAALQFTSSDSTTSLYIFIIASGIFFQSFEVVEFHFQARVLSKYASICKVVQLIISALLKLYFIVIEADLIYFVIVAAVDQLVLALTLAITYRQQKGITFFNRFDWSVARQLLLESWPLILSGLAIVIYMRIDLIMIKEMLGDHDVGIYASAVRISEAWYFIPALISSSLFPAIVNAKEMDEKLYYKRLQRLYTFLLWASVAVALPMTIVSPWLINILYGEAYNGAATVLMIHIWAGLFVALGIASTSWYINENLQHYAFYRTALGAVINVLLNLILIPEYGLVGAACATVISQAIAALFFDLLTAKTRIVFYMKIRAVYFAGIF